MRYKKASVSVVAGTTIAIVIFIVAIIVLLIGVDVVDANRLGVKVRFGNVLGAMGPGIQWTGLFTNVYQYDMRIRKSTIQLEGDFNAPDKEGQPIYATISVNYKVRRDLNTVINLYKNVGTDRYIADILNIEPIITEGFKQATVKYEALEILDKRQEVKELARANIKANFPKDYFDIVDIVIGNIHYSKQFQDAIDSKKTAIQLAEKAENDLERVKFEQQQEIEKYKAEAKKLELQKKQVTALLNQQKWIETWDGKLPTYMITTPDAANLLLPLPGTIGGESALT
ncbi:hypothetical protein LCGC14_0363590 [marine sediment metagenome]|uniref:Band 7 domain-containing protein n=1 Tax=marine sediment metagenome TaxID=412755 RepID=A0A0F9TQC6_9ZZZZ